ncbi:MAG: C39 family peptidase [Lachnospiraceae bacterium]|nr:C39 family peptidase [Lachnospiraceae bacterium]
MKNGKKHRGRRRIHPLFYTTVLLLFIDGFLLGVLAHEKISVPDLIFSKTTVPRVIATELGSSLNTGNTGETNANGEASGSAVLNAGGISSDASARTSVETPSEHLIGDFEIILQNPELPTGCEITALTMALCYYGFDADKITMASEYLPTAEAIFYYGSDGLKYGPDLNEYFVGDPFSSGYICGTPAIVTAADAYLEDMGSDMRANDLTGISFDDLYFIVSQDVPVVVWVTIDMETRLTPEGWYTGEGEWVEWSSNDHGAVLIGYTEDTVTVADPISGLAEYDRDAFESVFSSRGNQCVILQ